LAIENPGEALQDFLHLQRAISRVGYISHTSVINFGKLIHSPTVEPLEPDRNSCMEEFVHLYMTVPNNNYGIQNSLVAKV
jgi:hypothetical protein